MSNLNLINQHELVSVFAGLKRSIKAELAIWFEFVGAVSSAGHRNDRVVSDFAAKLGCSKANVRRKLTAWRATGDWKVFINKAKAGAAFWNTDRQTLPPEFIEYVRAQFCWNQRSCRPAYRKLIERWRRWHRGETSCAIPGYKECPPCDPSGKTPLGWSYRNLMRMRPDDFDLKAGRVGRAAASDLRLQVFTTRVGLRVGEFIQIDDHEFNLKVNFTSQTRAMRPRMLSALDVLSACDFATGFKPTLWDERTQTKKVLREVDTMWLVIYILTAFGYRTDERGTTIILEWGTANVPAAFCEAVDRITGGKVRFDRSGKFGKASFSGLFEGAVKGNYRFKACRESLWSLFDNELADLPGQVGKDRDHAPEEGYGLERYNSKLLRAAALLPPEKASMLLFPVLEWNQAIGLILDAFGRINHRTEHELEGWERAGFVTTEWRLDPRSIDWRPVNDLLRLAPEQQAIVRRLLDSASPNSARAEALCRARKLSPMEVFSAGRSELTPVPRVLYPDLMPEVEAREVRVDSGLLEFNDREISPDPLRYKAVVKGQKLPNGQKFLGYVNPFDASAIVLCRADGSVVGECPIWDAPCRNDVDAIQKKLGEAKQWESQALQNLGIRNIERTAARAAMHAHNAALLGVSPVTQKAKHAEHPVSIEDLKDLSSEQTQDSATLDTASPNTEPVRQGAEDYGASMDELREL